MVVPFVRAALTTIRLLEPAWLVAAVPIAAPEACESLRLLADEVVCAHTPEPFRSVGLWYQDFEQTTDDEVQRLLAANRERVAHGSRQSKAG